VIKVSVEVSGATANFIADVWAESVVEAINLAKACYTGGEARLLFPIDPNTFFTQERAAGTMIVSTCTPSAKASDVDEGEVPLIRPLAQTRTSLDFPR
jgi:hypothetical protein